MNSLLGENNYVARISAEEFLVIYRGSAENIPIIANDLYIKINGIINFLNDSIEVSTSIGVAINQDKPLSFYELLQHADVALHYAMPREM